MKKVLLKSRFEGWSLHSLYSELINFPPEGFKIMSYPSKKKLAEFYRIDNKSTNPILKEIFFHIKPIPYLLAQKNQKNNFEEYDIIYASQHIIFNSNKPWIVDLEFTNALAAYGNLNYIKNSVEKRLEQDSCKYIIPWSNWAKETLLLTFNNKKIKDKTKVIHYTVHQKNIKKIKHDGIRFLFVGSSNPMNEQNIQFKNIKEVILAFLKVSKKFDNLELIIRSNITIELLELTSKNKNIIVINSFLSKEKLEELYNSSDIFVLPSHETCGTSLLDGMSFGLPTISMNIYDIPEVISHMNNGILIEPSKEIIYYDKRKNPYDYSRQFMSGIKKSSDFIILQLEKNFELLIKDSALRERLGQEAQKMFVSGKFSIQKRNESLKQIFEESIK